MFEHEFLIYHPESDQSSPNREIGTQKEKERLLDRFERAVQRGDRQDILALIKHNLFDETAAMERWPGQREGFSGEFSETIFAKKRRLIQAGIALEEYLTDPGIGGEREKARRRYEERSKDIPARVRVGFERLKANYVFLVQTAEKEEAIIRGRYEEGVGEKMYQEYINDSPKASIRFERQEGYFIFTFNSSEDYTRLKAHLEGVQPDELLPSGGVFYSHGLHLPRFPKSPTILVGAGSADTDLVEQIVTHERQHFLNHSLGLVRWGEGGVEHDQKQKRSRISLSTLLTHRGFLRFQERIVFEGFPDLFGYKDELLAFLRDGEDPSTILTNLTEHALYAHLSHGFSDVEKKRVRDLLKRITVLLEYVLYLGVFRTRQELVYFLVDIPLQDIPAVLERAIDQWNACKYRADEKDKAVMAQWLVDTTAEDPYETFEQYPKQIGHRKRYAVKRPRRGLTK